MLMKSVHDFQHMEFGFFVENSRKEFEPHLIYYKQVFGAQKKQTKQMEFYLLPLVSIWGVIGPPSSFFLCLLPPQKD